MSRSTMSRSPRAALLSVLVAGALACGHAPSAGAEPMTDKPSAAKGSDPFQWLEEVEGAKALAWVKGENARTLALLQGDPRYGELQAKARAVAEAKDRIPLPALRKGAIYNFWQDADHVRGLWRRTSLASYETAEPDWETVLDIDALARAEQANWVFKGANCQWPEDKRCLVSLSNGGKDAVSQREFDLETKAFVPGGFSLPESKQDAAWLDPDTLLIARDWGPGTMTPSGYPFVVKRLVRGQSLDQAVEVFRGDPKDVEAGPVVLKDGDGHVVTLYRRAISFFETEIHLATAKGPVKVAFPAKSKIEAFVSGQVILSLQEPWTIGSKTFGLGALVSVDAQELAAEPAHPKPRLIVQPGPREAIEGVVETKGTLLVQKLVEVRGTLSRHRFVDGAWTADPIALPDNATIGLVSASADDDQAFARVTGFLTPDTLFLVDAATGASHPVKSLPARFDAAGLEVVQYQATSRDGTRVPYFVVARKDAPRDGSNPTLLSGYGGFEVSNTPYYSGMIGKLWLERGGVFVLANIRGGGEFGPAWHQAGLKTKRQVIYDDFQAVALDLIARGITSQRRLGIQGGSNGGLLMGVTMVQRPDLFRAVVIQVPLLDMLRYHKLLAGASWVGEYGSPDIPKEAAFLRRISPYHTLRQDGHYPEPFFVTSTKDDRVHPGHARKMAAKMQAWGMPFLYYENTDGGHAAAANLQETAKRLALEFTYLSRKLID